MSPSWGHPGAVTTFMKLCTGLHAPTQSVSVDGAPVTGPVTSVWRFRMPTAALRTTLDNVLLPLEIVEPTVGSSCAPRGVCGLGAPTAENRRARRA